MLYITLITEIHVNSALTSKIKITSVLQLRVSQAFGCEMCVLVKVFLYTLYAAAFLQLAALNITNTFKYSMLMYCDSAITLQIEFCCLKDDHMCLRYSIIVFE